MVRKIKAAIRFGLPAYVANGIIYQFPCWRQMTEDPMGRKRPADVIRDTLHVM